MIPLLGWTVKLPVSDVVHSHVEDHERFPAWPPLPPDSADREAVECHRFYFILQFVACRVKPFAFYNRVQNQPLYLFSPLTLSRQGRGRRFSPHPHWFGAIHRYSDSSTQPPSGLLPVVDLPK